jgi:hypothetical protein
MFGLAVHVSTMSVVDCVIYTPWVSAPAIVSVSGILGRVAPSPGDLNCAFSKVIANPQRYASNNLLL